MDTCRADYLGCYDYPRNTSPNIDQLALESVLFANVISPIPLTLPAHCSMLTGTIPLQHGVHANSSFRFGKQNLTLAEILKQNDFTTAAIVGAFVLDSGFGISQGFDYYNDDFEEVLKNTGISERRGGEVSRFAMQWLDQHKSERFFLFLHYYDPHTEYDPPDPFASDFNDDLYAGEIAYTDFCIGQVIDKLKELELYDSAMIIVTGDHGEMLGEHGEEDHGYFIYRGAIDVPLIFKLPGNTEGKRVEDRVGLVDIVPTVCQELGIEVPDQLHGASLSGYFNRSMRSEPERYLYCESFYPSTFGANSLQGVVTDRWKYIETTRPELYDLIDDPGEKNNLIKQIPQQADILKDRLEHILKGSVREDVSDERMVLDEESRARLESLGYVTGIEADLDFKLDPTREDPKDAIDYHMLTKKARMLVFLQRYDEARSLFEEALAIRPQYHVAQLYLGAMAKEQGNLEGAIKYLSEAIRLKPSEPEVHHQLGDTYMQLGEYDSAVKHYEEALRIIPERIETLNNIGLLMNLLGRYEEAVAHLEKALEIDPNGVKALTNLGHALSRQGKVDLAEPHLLKAVELDPENLMAHVMLGLMLTDRREFNPAIEHLETALDIDPNQFDVLRELGRIYSHLGNIEQALAFWNRALQIKDDHSGLLNSLAWIKAANANVNYRDPEEAVRLARRACELTDYKDPSFLHTLATAHAADGNFPDAVKMAEKSLELFLTLGAPELVAIAEESLEMFKNGVAYTEPE
jgi:arylsulfatase A-like enzyme/Tfp pilus assembly protein PilF